ncbi:MAG: pentapeptide repeat-containing protein, partial [Deltaproteobacteria bacterium]|nr:pentapeptide repeat-containing protein [Deltaproteobacteria bacterium]
MVRKISTADLRQVYEYHKTWLSTDGEAGRYADLSDTKLCGMKLLRISLSKADLSGADLSSANLMGVNLKGTNLRGA